MTIQAVATTTPVSNPTERFDGNQTNVFGTVTKIWSRTGGDVYARILTQGKAEEEHPPRLTIMIPKGKIGGQDISLMPGDALLVQGWISDGPYNESLKNFLSRAKRETAFDT